MINSKLSPFDRYQEYIETLKQSGSKLPTNQFGDLNLSDIAKACGNRRQWFSESSHKIMPRHNKTLAAILLEDMRQIGTAQKAGEDADNALSKQSEYSKKENGRLRRKIDLMMAELVELRHENEALKLAKQTAKEESNEYLNVMEESGRSFKC